jgi:sarcosine oxidase, subunit gamma
MVDVAPHPHALRAQRRTALVITALQKGAAISVAPLDSAARFVLRVRSVTAASLPAVAGFALDAPMNTCVVNGTRISARLGPDEWLLLDPQAHSKTLESDLEAELSGRLVSLVDISQRNVGIAVAGTCAREVINGGCPLDLHDSAFPPGSATRTLLGKAEIVLLRPTENHAYRVECLRSFASYVYGYLSQVAREFEAN